MKAIGAALAQGDGAAFHNELRAGSLTLNVEGGPVDLSPKDVEVRLIPKQGFAAAQSRNMVVVISTEITEQLEREGWVRDLIRRVQDVRKDMGLPYDARIHVSLEMEDADLAGVVEDYRDAIAKEVLADSIDTIAAKAEHGKVVSIKGSEVAIAATRK